MNPPVRRVVTGLDAERRGGRAREDRYFLVFRCASVLMATFSFSGLGTGSSLGQR